MQNTEIKTHPLLLALQEQDGNIYLDLLAKGASAIIISPQNQQTQPLSTNRSLIESQILIENKHLVMSLSGNYYELKR
jgi:hypothetical protein